jgi:hypothetical protein
MTCQECVHEFIFMGKMYDITIGFEVVICTSKYVAIIFMETKSWDR